MITKKQGNLLEMDEILSSMNIKTDKKFKDYVDEKNMRIGKFNECLSYDDMQDILGKVRKDFYYFITNFAFVKSKTDYCLERDTFNINNLAAFKLLSSGQSLYMMTPRDPRFQGCNIAYYILWDLISTECTKSYTILSATTSNITPSILKAVLTINEGLPSYIKLDESELIERFRIIPRLSNRNKAEMYGRGTVSNMIIVESSEFKSYADIFLKSCLPAHRTMVNAGMDSQIIVMTTMGVNGTYEREFGDRMAMVNPKWLDDLFQVDLSNRPKEIFYLSRYYRDLVDNPDEVLEDYKTKYNDHIEAINQELFFKR